MDRGLRALLEALTKEELVRLVEALYDRVEGIITKEDLMAMIRRVMR